MSAAPLDVQVSRGPIALDKGQIRMSRFLPPPPPHTMWHSLAGREGHLGTVLLFPRDPKALDSPNVGIIEVAISVSSADNISFYGELFLRGLYWERKFDISAGAGAKCLSGY